MGQRETANLRFSSALGKTKEAVSTWPDVLQDAEANRFKNSATRGSKKCGANIFVEGQNPSGVDGRTVQ